MPDKPLRLAIASGAIGGLAATAYDRLLLASPAVLQATAPDYILCASFGAIAATVTLFAILHVDRDDYLRLVALGLLAGLGWKPVVSDLATVPRTLEEHRKFTEAKHSLDELTDHVRAADVELSTVPTRIEEVYSVVANSVNDINNPVLLEELARHVPDIPEDHALPPEDTSEIRDQLGALASLLRPGTVPTSPATEQLRKKRVESGESPDTDLSQYLHAHETPEPLAAVAGCPADAASLSGAGALTARLSGSSENWFTLTPQITDTYRLQTGPVEGLMDNVDTVMTLFDQEGDETGWDDDGGDGTYSLLREDLVEGMSYCLRITGYAGMTGYYTLAVTPERESASLRGLPSGSPTRRLPTNGERISGRLYGSSEQWYEFNVGGPARGRYVIETFPPGSPPGVDTVVFLYRESEGELALLGEDDDGRPDGYSQLVEDLVPGTYFVRVGSYWGEPGRFRIAVRLFGSFEGAP